MENSYNCSWFSIDELVPLVIFNDFGTRAWQFLDTKALVTLDRLRVRYGKAYVNTYSFGGALQWRGLRTQDSSYYSPTSQHSFGRAFDVTFETVTAEEVRQEIMARSGLPALEMITAIELDVDWLHFDTRNYNGLLTFRR